MIENHRQVSERGATMAKEGEPRDHQTRSLSSNPNHRQRLYYDDDDDDDDWFGSRPHGRPVRTQHQHQPPPPQRQNRQRRRQQSSSWTSLLSLSFVILLAFFPPPIRSAYIATIQPKDEECFYIRPPTGKMGTLYGNYDLLDDGLSSDPLSVVVVDYNEEHVLYRSRRRAREGTFTVKLRQDQKVALCLQNGLITAGRGRKNPTDRNNNDDDTERTIGFTYSIEAKDETVELKSQNERLVGVASDLTRELGNLFNHHQYMRTREAKHRELVEMTFSRLMVWIFVEGAAVILIAGGQILYLRRYMEVRRFM